MYELSIGILAGVAATALGGAGLLARNTAREASRARERASGRVDLEATDSRPRALETAYRVGQAVSKGRPSAGLRERLARAGYHSRSAGVIFLGTKVLLLVLGLLGFGLISLSWEFSMALRMAVLTIGAGSLFMVPDLVVAVRRDRRAAEIQRHLPDAIDLLEICVSSGMGLDMSWQAVSGEIRKVSPVLADEMELTHLEISLGAPRAQALRHMADRTGADELSSLVAVLIQSERFGASIVEALRTFAGGMRESQSKKAEESAEKMAVKMLFPMVLFIFPTLLIVMVGPAVLEIIRVMM